MKEFILFSLGVFVLVALFCFIANDLVTKIEHSGGLRPIFSSLWNGVK